MQVITGKYRFKKLKAPSEKTTRPTLQRAKETMFNMLPHNLVGKKVLDVFAGSGALGIEALSRGMGFCLFNEVDSKALNVLKENLESINPQEWKTISLDYKDLISRYKDLKFDLILIDPPYPIACQSLDYLLNSIDKYNMLTPGGLITGEVPHDCKMIDEFNTFKLKKIKQFSKLTRIWQYEKK